MRSDPDTWETVRLGDIAEVKGGKRLTAGEQLLTEPNGAPYLRTSEITDGVFDRDRLMYTPSSAQRRNVRYTVSTHDIFISIVGTIGLVAIVLPDLDGAFLTENAAKIVARQGIADPLFVTYFLRSPQGQSEIAKQTVGSTQKKLALFRIKDIPIILPPFEQQRRTASVLQALDDKINSNRRLATLLGQAAAAIFKARFVDPIGTDGVEGSETEWAPGGWRVGVLADLCDTRYGYTAAATEGIPSGPRFLRVKDINKQPWIEWAKVPYCEIDEQQVERFALIPGDVVVARMADPGKAAIVLDQVDAVCASYLVRLRPPSLAWGYFIHSYTRSTLYAAYIDSVMSGSVQKNINARVLTEARLAIPPTDEVSAFADVVGPLYQHQAGLIREVAALISTRDALLPKLISGEIRVPDTTDPDEIIEPATERLVGATQ